MLVVIPPCGVVDDVLYLSRKDGKAFPYMSLDAKRLTSSADTSVNPLESHCPPLVVPATSPLYPSDPDGFTSSLRSRGRWHVVITSDATRPIGERTGMMFQPSFVLLLLKVTLRSTFQRSRGIIVKRLAPFSLERSGFTSVEPPLPSVTLLAALVTPFDPLREASSTHRGVWSEVASATVQTE